MFGLVPFSRRNHDLTTRSGLFDFGRVFDEFFNEPFAAEFFTSAQLIKADIRETDKEYIIEADMPGVKKEDIKLELKDGVLTVGVEHDERTDEKREDYIRKERRYGSYCRSFSVEGVKQEDVSAKYNDGVLTVTLPKSEEVKEKTHRININ